jgi:hypothetical protein
VHPTLAKILAQWKLAGWPAQFGRPPKEDDLLLPNRASRYLNDQNVNGIRASSFEMLGLRSRRFHDARRTFISLAQADGALPHVLKLITHTPAEVIDLYTTLPWRTLCDAVGKLKLELRQGDLLPLRAVGGGPTNSNQGGNLSQSLSQKPAATLQPSQLLNISTCPRRDSNPRTLAQKDADGENHDAVGKSGPTQKQGKRVLCDSVTEPATADMARRARLLLVRYGGVA